MRAESERVVRAMCAWVGDEYAPRFDVALDIERLSADICVNIVAQLAEIRRLADCVVTRSALADKLVEARIASAFAEQIGSSLAPPISGSGTLRRRAEEIARAISRALPIDNRIVSVPARGRPSVGVMPQKSADGSLRGSWGAPSALSPLAGERQVTGVTQFPELEILL